jgi:lipocalin-like protein
MNRQNTLAVISASLLLLSLAVPTEDAAAQSVKSVTGSYTVVSVSAYGPNARGRMMLGADGRYSIVIARATLPKFASNSRIKGTADEYKGVVEGSIAHYGTYTVDDGGKVLTLNIEVSTFSNFDGTSQRRPFKVSGDLLTYTVSTSSAPGPAADVVWKRIK